MAPPSFIDYSEVLKPLPQLPVDGTSRPAPVAEPETRSFRDELFSQLDTNPSYPAINADSLRLPGAPLEGEDFREQLKEVCREIEGFMLGLLMKNMADDFGGSSIFSKSYESNMYQEMFYQELSESISKQPPGLGIADTLYHDIIMKVGDSIDEMG